MQRSNEQRTTIMILPFSEQTDEQVQQSLRTYQIGLTVEEARKVSELLGHDPTLVEAVIWGIQGSEHCSYKSSRNFLKMLPTEGGHIILGPKEDSGIVAITDAPSGKRWGLVIAHESHNHPSQIVPFEGAATGVGGVVRDVVCMGARVIGCMDLLRLGDLKSDESCTIATEVIRGIGGYGNPLGIPNLGGDTAFDTSYNSNCLVNAVALGIVREDEIIHSYVPEEAGQVGYDIILVGKPTDRSGFGGAAFASASMEEEEQEQNTSAVQEPNPFLERHLLASTYALFDWLAREKKLDKVSCKDLGAGGVVCASVEQVADQGFGAQVRLDDIHVSIQDLPPEVISCAETQERLCWTCHPDLTEHILRHYNEAWDLPSVAEHARASVIGKVTPDGIYRLTFQGKTICEAKALDITCGLLYNRPTAPAKIKRVEPDISCRGNKIIVTRHSSSQAASDDPTSDEKIETTITEVFRTMLQHPNHASKAPAFRHYDKNVIGNTILEPGEADAGVVAPLQDLESYMHEGEHPGWNLSDEERWRGVAIAGDGNGRYGRISPYWQGFNAAVEAMQNVAAVGATPRALTDCLNYGNPEIPEQLWALEEGIKGITDAVNGVQIKGEVVPVISGNVSLYNGKPDGSAIDPTAIVSCVGVLPDARKAVSIQLKQPGSELMLIGERRDECGGSAYYEVLEQMAGAPRDALLGSALPHPNTAEVAVQIQLVTGLIEQGLILSCHDISEGGMLLALFEMMVPQRKVGGDIGINVNLDTCGGDLPPDTLLFTQTGGFVLEVAPDQTERVREISQESNTHIVPIGSTLPQTIMKVQYRGNILISEQISQLLPLWETGLSEAFKRS